MRIKLIREYHKTYTKGRLVTPFGKFFILELPYKDNLKNVSCIPEGVYTVYKSSYVNSKGKNRKCFRFKSVPNRSGILIHIGNYTFEIAGCLLVGMKFRDELQMVQDSTIAFNVLWKSLPEQFEIEIKTQQDFLDFVMFDDYKGLEQESKVKPIKTSSNLKKSFRNVLIVFVIGFILKLFKAV